MPTLEYLLTYFTSPFPLATLAVTVGAEFASYCVFLRNPENFGLRVRILVGLLFLSIFAWLFIITSIAFCGILWERYEENVELGVKTVLSASFSSAAIAAFPVSLLVRNSAADILLRKFRNTELVPERIDSSLRRLSAVMGVDQVALVQADFQVPVCLAVGGEKGNVIFFSNALAKLLDEEEMETVLAHELAHIRGGDSTIRTLARTSRMLFPFDPIISLIETVIHREGELVADEAAALATKKPLALASALIKIHEAMSAMTTSRLFGMGMIGLGKGVSSKHTPLTMRIERLSRLAHALHPTA